MRTREERIDCIKGSLEAYSSKQSESDFKVICEYIKELENNSDNQLRQVAELQEKLSESNAHCDRLAMLNGNYLNTQIAQSAEINSLKDKLHRRNMQIKSLNKDKAECYRLSALLGRLGYDLHGNLISGTFEK